MLSVDVYCDLRTSEINKVYEKEGIKLRWNSFDSLNDTSSWIYLEEASVDSVASSELLTLEIYDFSYGDDGWQETTSIPGFNSALSSSDTGQLGLCPNGATNVFGYWFSPDIAVQDGKVYKARFNIRSSVTDPDDTLQIRARAFQKTSWQAWDRGINSFNQQAPSSTTTGAYDVYITPNVTSLDDAYCGFGFDLMSFDPSDDVNSWIYLDSFEFYEVSITP